MTGRPKRILKTKLSWLEANDLQTFVAMSILRHERGEAKLPQTTVSALEKIYGETLLICRK